MLRGPGGVPHTNTKGAKVVVRAQGVPHTTTKGSPGARGAGVVEATAPRVEGRVAWPSGRDRRPGTRR